MEAIDTAMKLGPTTRWARCSLPDFIGLDTCLSIMQVYSTRAGPIPSTGPCPLLVKYVEAGWLGPQGPGRGFYDSIAGRDPGWPTR